MSTETKDKLDILEYEAGSVGLVMSFVYRAFPILFIWKCNRKWNRYQKYLSFKRKKQQP